MDRYIGKYELVSELGQGGFGAVYLARDPAMNRLVALKLMHGPTDPSRLSRFRNEAVITGNLNHPNLVTVFDLGDHEGNPYIAMEYLKGQDLSKLLKAKPGPDQADRVRILAGTLAGLRSAHDRGVVHRDIKPANIMLLEDGGVKIMDFGIARITSMALDRNTQTGMVIGSLQWMAPEQFRGTDADIQTDIWSLGVTAYELFTSVHPFEGDSMHTGQMIYQIMSGKIIPARYVNPKIPAALDALIHRMMQRDRSERYQSVEDIELDLQPISMDLGRERAAAIAERASKALQTDAELALRLAREGLDLDPHNQALRGIRDQVMGARKRTRARARVEGLLRSAEEAIREQRFEDARADIHTAKESDSEVDASSEQRLQVLERFLQEQAQIDELISQAKKTLAAGDLESARLALGQAHSIRPGDSSVREVGLQYREAREQQKRASEIGTKLDACEAKLAQRDAAGALELLLVLPREEVRAAGYEVRFSTLLQSATDGERLTRIWARAREFEDAGKFDEAAAALEAAEADTGEWPEIGALRKRVVGVAQAVSEASSLLQAGKLRQAAKLISESLQRFGQIPALLELGRKAELWQGVETAQQASDWPRALAFLEEIRRVFPGTAVEEKRIEITARRSAQLRAMEQPVLDAFRREQWAEASRLASEGIRVFPEESSFREWLGEAQRRQWLAEAETAIRQQQWDDARVQAEAALRTHPGDTSFQRILDEATRQQALAAAIRSQNWEQARRAAETALQSKPDDAQLRRTVTRVNAQAALQKGLWSEALSQAAAGLAVDQLDDELRGIALQAARGGVDAAIAKQQWDQAAGLASSALRTVDDPALRRSLLLAQASSALAAKRWEDAAALCKQGLQLDPGDVRFREIALQAARGGVDAAIAKQQWDQAAGLASSALQTVDDPALRRSLLLAQASSALAAKRWEDAAAKGQQGLQLDPGDVRFREIALQAARGGVDAAIAKQQWDQAAGLASSTLRTVDDPALRRSLLLAQASSALAAKRWEDAETKAQTGLEHSPGDPKLREVSVASRRALALVRAQEALDREDWGEAVRVAEGVQPSDAAFQRVVLAARASAAVQEQQWEKAKGFADEGLRANRGDMEFRRLADQALLGIAQASVQRAVEREQWEEAKKQATTALAKAPQHPYLRRVSMLASARLAVRKERWDEARQCGEEGLKAFPGDATFLEILQRAAHESSALRQEAGQQPTVPAAPPAIPATAGSSKRSPAVVAGGIAVVLLGGAAGAYFFRDSPKDPPPSPDAKVASQSQRAVSKAESKPVEQSPVPVEVPAAKPDLSTKRPADKAAEVPAAPPKPVGGAKPTEQAAQAKPLVEKKVPEEVAVLKREPSASTPAPPVVADADVPDYGTFSWEGSLEPGTTLSFNANRPSSGSIRGLQLLGVPVRLTIISPRGIEIVQAPSNANRWIGFSVRNSSGASVDRIRLRWDTIR